VEKAKVKETFVDANAILRYILGEPKELLLKVEDFFEDVRIGRRKAMILTAVLAECVYVLEKFYRVPREEISITLSRLLRYKGILGELEVDTMISALEVYSSSKLDFVDSLLCAIGGKRENVLSLDEDVLKCISIHRGKS
jgi:predicted nucleic-acid-binding protein